MENTELTMLAKKAASALLPEIQNPDDPQSFEQNFKEHSAAVCDSLYEIGCVFRDSRSELHENLYDRKSWAALAPILILCGEHSKQNPWTSPRSLECSKNVLREISETVGVENAEDLIRAVSAEMLSSLSTKLRKDAFAAFPAAVTVYLWILFQHEHPFLSDILHLVLPTTLVLVDDFRDENQITGLRCVHHIIKQTDRSELIRYGRAELLFDALKPLQYKQNRDLVEYLYPALISCMQVVSPHPEDSSTWLKVAVWDESINLLLNNLNLSQDDIQKLLYLDVITNIINIVQARYIRFLTPTLTILDELLDVNTSNVDAYRKVLQVLFAILRYCWPCMSQHEDLFWILVKFTHDVVKLKPDLWNQFKEEVRTCVAEYQKAAESVVADFCNDLKANANELDEDISRALLYICN